jgi:hypothetical protein
VNKTENFKDLLDQGISNFAGKIVEIGELAIKELEIEVSLQAMQETITQYEVKHSVDPVSSKMSRLAFSIKHYFIIFYNFRTTLDIHV